MEKNNQKTVYQEYAEDFKNMLAEELIDAFNRQVGNNGWIGRKITYICALHTEFNNRGYDYSVIGNRGGICLKNKIKLDGKTILIAE